MQCTNRFFQLMGSVFSFVSSDLKQKIDILCNLKDKDNENYITVKSMIEYEKENKLLEKPDYVNGARTLLRLHRGLGIRLMRSFILWFYSLNISKLICISALLDFIREFLRQLGDLSDIEKTANCCQDAYNKTLAKHHPWVIRKAAIVAMYTMPTRKVLFKKVNQKIFFNRIFRRKGKKGRIFLSHINNSSLGMRGKCSAKYRYSAENVGSDCRRIRPHSYGLWNLPITCTTINYYRKRNVLLLFLALCLASCNTTFHIWDIVICNYYIFVIINILLILAIFLIDNSNYISHNECNTIVTAKKIFF